MGGSGKNGAVRQYIRSNVPRMRWTSELHRSFVDAVERLSGRNATPKLILREMGVRGLTIAHVKSHLQMYRSREMSRQYTSQCNGGRRQSYEGNTEDEYHDSLTYPKTLREFQLLYSPPVPLKSQFICETVSAQYNIDDCTQDFDDGCGMKDFSSQDAAESGYFMINEQEKQPTVYSRTHNVEQNDVDERLRSAMSMLENDHEEEEINGCSLTLSLALHPKQESDDSSMSGRSCVMSSSPRSFKHLSGFSDGRPVNLEISMSICGY